MKHQASHRFDDLHVLLTNAPAAHKQTYTPIMLLYNALI